MQDVGAVEPVSGLAEPGAHSSHVGEAGATENDPAGHDAQAAGEVALKAG